MADLLEQLTRAADSSEERKAAAQRFADTLGQVTGDVRFDLEEAFSDAWLAAAYAVAEQLPRVYLFDDAA